MPTLLFGPSLEYPRPLAATLVQQQQTHLPTGAALRALPTSFTADAHVAQLSRLHRNVQFVSVLDAVCDNQDCPLKVDADTSIIWDTIHLTPEGSTYVLQRLKPALDAFLGGLAQRQDVARQATGDTKAKSIGAN